MLRKTLLALVSLALLGSAVANPVATSFVAEEPKRYDGHQVFRVFPKSEKDTLKLNEATQDLNFGLDVWAQTQEYTDVRVPPSSLSSFKSLGLDYEVYVADVQQLVDSESAPAAAGLAEADYFSAYHNLAEIKTFVSGIISAYPAIATAVSIGKTYEGNDIFGVRLGKPGTNKKEFVLHGGIHAREWISTATVTYFLNELATKYGTDATITNLLNTIDFTIFPVLNPDGFLYTYSKDRMWRKNRQPTPTASCVGIDPNRNFGYMWAQGGSSSSACNDAYHGTKAFEALETLHIYNYINSRPNVAAYTDLHAYSQLFMYPLGASCTLKIPDAAELKTVATAAVAKLTALYNTKYTVGDICNTIYQASGSSVDTIYMNSKVKLSFAVELRDTGSYGFLLPASQIIPTGKETTAALLYIGEYIAK